MIGVFCWVIIYFFPDYLNVKGEEKRGLSIDITSVDFI